MASIISTLDIHRKHLPFAVRALMMKINAGTATATDAHATPASLAEKDVCLALIAGTATRQQIMASNNLPPFKEAALQMAGFTL